MALLFVAAAPASASPPVPVIADWFAADAKFDSGLELGSIANISCGLKSLFFDIGGRIEIILPQGVMPVTPLAPIHFKLKKGEAAFYKVPLHFLKELRADPIVINYYFEFPKADMIKSVESSVNFSGDEEEKQAVIRKIKSADDIFQISHKLDFIITANEGFTDFAAGIYDDYLKSGFLIKRAGLSDMAIASVKEEIARYEELIATVRNAAELKAYLSTHMDMVSGEDKYLNLLYAAAYHYFTAGDLDSAGKYLNKLNNEALKAAVNVDTAEIYVDSSISAAVLDYLAGKKKESLAGFEKVRNFCGARSDARLRYAYYNIANYYKIEGDLSAAADNYRKALAVKPGFTACTNELKKIND
jgi:tetratricopeptide (TPR) repeat protein